MPPRSKSKAFVGISGWLYPRWRKRFYPEGLPQKQELAYAASKVGSIELNGSFYSLQAPTSFKRWYAETPDDFIFAVKGSRYITHMLKLKNVQTPLANFFAQGVLALQQKLGPVLWQFPEQVQFNEQRFADFFALLPRTRKAAAKLAKGHDHRVDPFTRVRGDGPIRHCIEPRHPSFASPAALRLLREHNIALVVSDSAGRFPMFTQVTADFVYVRLHGSTHLYHSGYSDDELRGWHDRIKAWRRDVYVYFDNDALVHAPFDAMRLQAMVSAG